MIALILVVILLIHTITYAQHIQWDSLIYVCIHIICVCVQITTVSLNNAFFISQSEDVNLQNLKYIHLSVVTKALRKSLGLVNHRTLSLYHLLKLALLSSSLSCDNYHSAPCFCALYVLKLCIGLRARNLSLDNFKQIMSFCF